MPSVSVVIPTYNRATLLARMLEPLLAEPDPLEVVVVVDGCQDGSIELLRERAESDGRLRPLLIDNGGMDAARMAGVRAARGDVVLLLDDDVVVEPGTVRGHAKAHGCADHLVVVGSMPVAGGPQRNADDYPRVMYAREYSRHCQNWIRHPETVLPTLWAGHLSLRREDLLTLDPPVVPELGRSYHSDVDFGLRCQAAGLKGVYVPSLRARHFYERGPEAFLRDARNSGRSLRLLHESHPAELGAATEATLLRGLPLPLRPMVRRSRTRRWPARVAGAGVTTLGALHLYRLQRGAAHVRKRIEQMHELASALPPAGTAVEPGEAAGESVL